MLPCPTEQAIVNVSCNDVHGLIITTGHLFLVKNCYYIASHGRELKFLCEQKCGLKCLYTPGRVCRIHFSALTFTIFSSELECQLYFLYVK